VALELGFNFRTLTAIRAPPLRVYGEPPLPPLSDAPIQDNLDRRIRGEAFAQVLIKVRVSAGDNKEGPRHRLLVGCRVTACLRSLSELEKDFYYQRCSWGARIVNHCKRANV